MCSASVEPRPSRSSTPKRSFHASDSASGSASPARHEAGRTPASAAARLGRCVLEERAVRGRHREEERRPLLGEDAPRPRGDERVGRQHRRRAGGERELDARAEPVGEEELRGRVGDVVGPRAEDPRAVAVDHVPRRRGGDGRRPSGGPSSPSCRARARDRRRAPERARPKQARRRMHRGTIRPRRPRPSGPACRAPGAPRRGISVVTTTRARLSSRNAA